MVSKFSISNPGTVLAQPVQLFLQCTAMLILLYIAKHPFPNTVLKFVFFAGMLSIFIFSANPLSSLKTWTLFLIYILFFLITKFLWVANHHFVAAYMIIAILMYLSTTDHQEVRLRFHIRFMLGAVLAISAFHKILSPTFMNGTFFLYEMEMHHFLKPLKWAMPGWESAVRQNNKLLNDLIQTNPNTLTAVPLIKPVSNIYSIATSATWLAVFLEVLAGIAVWIWPQKKATHVILLATLAGVFFMRFETGFLSLLATMGLLLAPGKNFRLVYVTCIIIFAAMIITGIGIH
jgi:hypothetical protein